MHKVTYRRGESIRIHVFSRRKPNVLKDIIRDLADRDQHNLRLRFQVGLGVILFCFCLFTATAIYHFQKRVLEEETAIKTHLVMTTLESTRGYIREVLRPKMYEAMGEDYFMIEAMSTSYITRVIMDRFGEKIPTFRYRRVALDARNPAFEADGQELEMIAFFKRNPDLIEQQGMDAFESGQAFTLYRPVVFRSSCLHCHGRPNDAPSAIRNLYGAEGGFHRQEDEIAGLLSISIPVDTSLARIRNTSLHMFGSAILLALLLYTTIWLLFHQLIITNLRDVLTLFRSNLMVDKAHPKFRNRKGHREELEELFAHARTLVDDLKESRSQLQKYTDNLELKVTERTEALKRSQDLLQEQVKKRNRELLLYNTLTELITATDSLETILRQTAIEVLQVVPAKGAGIYLRNAPLACFRLWCEEQAPELPEKIPIYHKKGSADNAASYLADCGRIKLVSEDTRENISISIPLCCRSQLLGLMVLSGLHHDLVSETMLDLLLSVGQQIGITIESLQNIRQLIRSSELLQSVFDGISDPLILMDPDGRLQMVNEAFLLRHDLSRSDILGMKLDEIGSERQCFFSGQLQAGELLETVPHSKEVQIDDGSIYDTRFYPITNRDGSIRAIVCFGKDITSVKETERRIRHTEKLVAIGQLAAGVAHEINNPLGVILCHTNLIRENNTGDKELIDDINIIERHTENCRRIVADLLDFSRSRGTAIVLQTQSVNAIMDNVLSMTQRQFSAKRIHLEKNFSTADPCCQIDGSRIRQVFLNLVMNSVQAVEEDGKIKVTTATMDDQAVIKIEDSGPGIDKSIIDKIFDPFFTTKEPGRGTGLGLSISYGIIREHNGEITVDSKLGEFTCFTITIPEVQPLSMEVEK